MNLNERTKNKSVEYYTPEFVFRDLAVDFDIDMASPEEGPVPWIPAQRFVTPSIDGLGVPLSKHWCARCLDYADHVYLPYGDDYTYDFSRCPSCGGATEYKPCRIWCNPPYGNLTLPFLKRMRDHGNGIGLVFSRTDNEWFHDCCMAGSGILFIRRRISFVDKHGVPRPAKNGGKGSPGAASILISWGDECAEILKEAAARSQVEKTDLRGKFVDLRKALC